MFLLGVRDAREFSSRGYKKPFDPFIRFVLIISDKTTFNPARVDCNTLQVDCILTRLFALGTKHENLIKTDSAKAETIIIIIIQFQLADNAFQIKLVWTFSN